MFISVIVCTRNRCDKLHVVLDSLDAVEIPPATQLEIVVVDNGSTDDTAKRFQEYAASKQRNSAPNAESSKFRYVYEGTRGKSSALNTGMRAARGEVFAFTDDDCVAAPDWIVRVAEVFADPSVGLAGGRVELYDKRDRPSTLITNTEPVELANDLGMFFKPLIIGANTVFRRSVFEAVGDYDLKLGPGSRASAVAEDMDYVYRAYRKGFRVVFRPELVMYHNHGRQTDEEDRRTMFAYKKGRGSFYAKFFFSDAKVRRMVLRDCGDIFVGFVRSAGSGMLPRHHSRVLWALLTGAVSRF